MTSAEPLAGISPRAIRDVRPRDLIIRFAFGAVVSAVAAVLAIVIDPRFAGIFMAFPAILPATLTLIEEEGSERKAKDDDVGAILGAAALVLFGGLTWWLVPKLGAAPALVIAIGGWLIAAVTLYLGLRIVRSRQR